MPSIFLFDTPLGRAGIGWKGRTVESFALPSAEAGDAAERLGAPGDEARPAVPPPWVAALAERVRGHLDGESDTFSDVRLGLSRLTPFQREVSRLARKVAPGETVTYGELAARAGRPGAARAVGQTMARNRIPLLVPCHRVLGADGSLTGFSAPGALGAKLRLLTVEGADLSTVAAGGVRHLRKADPSLAAVIRRAGPFSLAWMQRQDHFTALVESIVHQQVSMAAGKTIFARLLARGGGGPELEPETLLGLDDGDLRAAGLSRQKASYVRDLARRTADGTLHLERLARRDDEPVIAALTEVRGIGRWSAEMFLMFRLGRLDVLPVGDLGVRKGMQVAYELPALPSPRSASRIGDRWAPFRSIGSWYMWRAAESGGI